MAHLPLSPWTHTSRKLEPEAEPRLKPYHSKVECGILSNILTAVPDTHYKNFCHLYVIALSPTLVFMSVIYFEFIFVHGVRLESKFIFFLRKDFLIGKAEFKGRSGRERHSVCWFTPQWPGPSQAKANNFFQVPMWVQMPRQWDHLVLFSQTLQQ